LLTVLILFTVPVNKVLIHFTVDSVQSVLTLYQKVVKLCKNGYSMNKTIAQVNRGLHSSKRTRAIAILYITDYTKFEEVSVHVGKFTIGLSLNDGNDLFC
jgi:uncharacterized paraquat-inducible protein A